MDINCVPVIADLFLFCYERKFILSLSREIQGVLSIQFNVSIFGWFIKLITDYNDYFQQMFVKTLYKPTLVK